MDIMVAGNVMLYSNVGKKPLSSVRFLVYPLIEEVLKKARFNKSYFCGLLIKNKTNINNIKKEIIN